MGFAMETENLLENAAEKVKKKNLIAANDLNEAGADFAADTNAVKLIDRKEMLKAFRLKQRMRWQT